ncbi:MAG: hypothetical protein V1843_03195, partial [bacterium]
EVVRHPLYMIKQEALNMESIVGGVRDFTIYFEHKDMQLPYYVHSWKDLFLKSNPMERAIYYIDKLTSMSDELKKKLCGKYSAQILTVPFEQFVLDPWPYIRKIENMLGTRATRITRKMMKKQKVPRKRYAEGIGLAIYKRCGWEPPKSGTDEQQELLLRREFATKEASAKAMDVLDRLSEKYESTYLKDMDK